ncbi:DNA-processing protein DprA [Granulicella sp. S156]|uniref:DNA-processing protein DprA n=1 Tax=Granulicella sp. S156 TaxID=1747224 RepID=UPI00131DF05C|nr:DNA-processing protein DprA [Granulicella sp. S156]
MSQGVKEEARLAWLALVLTPRMGPTRCGRAVQRLGAAERMFSASLTELESTGMPAESAQFCYDGRARAAALDEAQRLAEAGASFVTPEDDDYPQRLLEIYDPPPVLWVRGNASLLNRAGIAVVGTRHPTPYGAGMAEMLSRDLARRGVVIFSGMARGVDTCAHKGALEAGGTTIAVWGTGIDVIYPKENKKLAEQIVQQGGALVSEFPMGTFPAPQNFPIRNRTLSGMSVGVLVVEAAEYSGTRITARCAIEQSRDVYAVPGNATNKNAWGPNTLIKQGAKLTATWEDVWEDLPSQVRVELEGRLEEQAGVPNGARNGGNESSGGGSASLFSGAAALFPEAATLPPMSEQERLVMQHLRQDEALQLDELIERLEPKMVSGEVFTALFELELAGRVKQMPGKNYVRSF